MINKIFGLLLIIIICSYNVCESKEKNMNDSEKTIKSLIKQLNTKEQPDIIKKLVSIGEPAVPFLIDKVNATKNKNIKSACIYTLGLIGSEKAVPVLCMTIKDKNHYIREFSAEALANIKHASAFSALASAFQDKKSFVRQAAVLGLGKTKSKKAIDILIKGVNDTNNDVRCEIISAFEIIGDQSSAPVLRNMLLNDADDLVRFHAALLLFKWKDKKSLPAFVEIINNNKFQSKMEVNVASVCLSAIKEMDKELTDKSIDILYSIAKEGNDLSRHYAVLSLGYIKTDKAIVTLIRLIPEIKYNAEIVEYLHIFTGQDFGTDAGKWRAWWEANKEKLLKKE